MSSNIDCCHASPARKIQMTIGLPSTSNFLHIKKNSLLPNCPISTHAASHYCCWWYFRTRCRIPEMENHLGGFPQSSTGYSWHPCQCRCDHMRWCNVCQQNTCSCHNFPCPSSLSIEFGTAEMLPKSPRQIPEAMKNVVRFTRLVVLTCCLSFWMGNLNPFAVIYVIFECY
jgi:hypothetical protein